MRRASCLLRLLSFRSSLGEWSVVFLEYSVRLVSLPMLARVLVMASVTQLLTTDAGLATHAVSSATSISCRLGQTPLELVLDESA